MDHEYCPYCMNQVEPGEPCPACGLTAGAYAPSPHHLPPGTVLRERYLIGRVLGEGGFGITYIGCDLRLELKVAIKEYFPTDRANRVAAADLSVSSYSGAAGERYESGKNRFLQEARTMARMDKQPVIVSVRDFFELNNTAYIVMEYVEGTTFKDLVAQKGGRIPAGELLHEIEPLFHALEAMHRQGLIHRDISPENLMLENGDVRLLDFGCARESAGGDATLTIALKHGYAPVEQYQNKGQGPWTDVYALSATIYYCLTGRKPPQSMDRLVDDELVLPRKLGVDLTVRQEKALLYGMGVRPRKRFQSIQELHAALYEGVMPAGFELPPELKAVTEEQEPVRTQGEAPQPEPTQQAEPQAGEEPAKPAVQETPEGGAAETPGASGWLRAHWPVAAGIGAAAILLIVLLAWHPWAANPSTADGDGGPGVSAGQPAPAASHDPVQTAEPVPTAFSSGQTADENGLVLLAMLADDGIDEVTIPADVQATVHEHVTLTKPLIVRSQYSHAYFPNGLTVAQGGRLQIIWGSVNAPSLLRTVDGGTVSVEAGGQLYSSLIWLEQEGDLTADPNGTVDIWGGWDPTQEPLDDLYPYSHYMILDEEALFEGAVQVSSGEEFAAACQGGAPIVVSGEITLPEYCCAAVPILIPEGCALNAPCDDENGDCTLDVDCTVLVNYGALRGRVSLMDMSADQTRANPRLLNFGTVQAELNSFAGYAAPTVVNDGWITLSGAPRLEQVCFANLGRVTVPQGVDAALHGNPFLNAGELAISGGTWAVQGAHLDNFSSITVEEEGLLVNHGNFNGEFGLLEVRPGSTVENYTKMELGDSKFTLYPNVVDRIARFRNEGILMYGADCLDFAEGALVSGEGRMLHFSWYDSHDDDSIRYVETERDLRQALANPAVGFIIWNWNADNPDSRIEITGGDLEITKGVYLNAPGVNYGGDGVIGIGDVTVTGENAFLILNNIDFNRSDLRVENGGAVLVDGSDDPSLGILSVDSGGLFVPLTHVTVNGPAALTGGGRIVSCGGMDVRGGPVTIGEGSALDSYNWLGLERCTVTNDGTLTVFGGIDQEGGSLTNNGALSFAGGGNLSGRIVNGPEGVITLEDGSPQDCPVLHGTLDNQGVVRAPNGGDLNVDGGTVTGNLIQYE